MNKINIISIDVGYRNLATVLGEVCLETQKTRVIACDVKNVLGTLKRPKSVLHTANAVIDHVDHLVKKWGRHVDTAVVEQQVRASGLNYGIAYGLFGYFKCNDTDFTFLPPKRKFELCSFSNHPNLKKRAVEEVMHICEMTNIDIENENSVDLSAVISTIKALQKKDDAADAILQLLTHGRQKCANSKNLLQFEASAGRSSERACTQRQM